MKEAPIIFHISYEYGIPLNVNIAHENHKKNKLNRSEESPYQEKGKYKIK